MASIVNIPYLGNPFFQPVTVSAPDSWYGIVYSHEVIGGYQEVISIEDRDAIPVNPAFAINEDNFSSGRRRVGMLVHVVNENKTYRLIPYGFFGNGDSTDWGSATSARKVLGLDPRKTIISEYSSALDDFITIGPITGTTTSYKILTGTTSNPPTILPSDTRIVSPWVEVTSASGGSLINTVYDSNTGVVTYNFSDSTVVTGYTYNTPHVYNVGSNGTNITIGTSSQYETGTNYINPDIYVNRGETYIFKNSGTNTFPFIISKSDYPTVTAPVNIINNSAAPSTDVIFTIPQDAQGVYYYFGNDINKKGRILVGQGGTSGTSGVSGTSGTSGLNGTSGTSGTNGLSGTSGTSGVSGISTYSAYTGVTLSGNSLLFSGHTIPNTTIDLTPILNSGIVSGTTTAGIGGTRDITMSIKNSNDTDITIDMLKSFTFKNTNVIKKTVGGLTANVDNINNLSLHEIIQRIFFPIIAPTFVNYSSVAVTLWNNSTNLTNTNVLAGTTYSTSTIQLRSTFTRGTYTLSVPSTTFYMGNPTQYNYFINGVAQTTQVSTSLTNVFSTFPSNYTVTSGSTNNSFYVSVPYSASSLYYDDLVTPYTDNLFTNSGTKVSTTINVTGCLPIFATISSISTQTQIPTLYSPTATLNISSGLIGSAIPLTLIGESGLDKQIISIPSAMVGTRTVIIYAYNATSGRYDINETTSYTVTNTNNTYTPFGSSSITISYKQYRYNGTTRGTQQVAVCII